MSGIIYLLPRKVPIDLSGENHYPEMNILTADAGGPLEENIPDQTRSFDTKILSKFIYSLNIARQHVGGYPPTHPLIAKSVSRTLDLLSDLLEFQETLTLGVFRDSLLVSNATLDPRNPVYRKLAEELFDLGIAGLTFKQGLQRDDLYHLLKLISKGREPDCDQQKLTEQFRSLDCKGLQIKLIDYSAFSTTEEELLERVSQQNQQQVISLWDRFIEGMIDGSIDPEGSNDGTGQIDPELVASLIKRRQEQQTRGDGASYEESITSFLRELDQEDRAGSFRTEALTKLAVFVENLSPELRRQFLSSTFNAFDGENEMAEEVISHLSSDALFEALEDVNAKNLTIPPAIMNLLGKLSSQPDGSRKTPSVTAADALTSAALGEHLRALFQEDDPDRYIPGTYQHLLHSIVSAEDIPPIESDDIKQLSRQLCAQSIEKQLCHISLELLSQSPEPLQRESLAKTLHELLLYFLETGDFNYLLQLHKGIHSEKSWIGIAELQETLIGQKFLREILASLGAWGKDKFPIITELIRKVGPPFIEPLLDQLGNEKRMALRRFYMLRLAEMDGSIREPILARLRDTRWYYVRNLIALLRELGDPVTLHALRTMVNHPQPQVRLEVAKTLQQFNDPGIAKFILGELQSEDRERIQTGLGFAERHCRVELLPALLNLLERKDSSDKGWSQKLTVVRLLSHIASPDALPPLEAILISKNMRHARQLNRLKLAIVENFKYYSRIDLKPILELLIANGGELGAIAEEVKQTRRIRR